MADVRNQDGAERIGSWKIPARYSGVYATVEAWSDGDITVRGVFASQLCFGEETARLLASGLREAADRVRERGAK